MKLAFCIICLILLGFTYIVYIKERVKNRKKDFQSIKLDLLFTLFTLATICMLYLACKEFL